MWHINSRTYASNKPEPIKMSCKTAPSPSAVELTGSEIQPFKVFIPKMKSGRKTD